MSEDEIKKVIDETEKSHRNEKQEKAKEKIKEIVAEYLKRIDGLDTKIDELQSEKKQLKLTLDDLKSGKLDVLKERLEKDEKARKINTIEIREIYIHHDHSNPYYVPYVINYPPVTYPWQNPVVYCGVAGGQVGILTSGATCQAEVIGTSFTTTGAECKNYSVGTYSIGTGVVNFR